MTRLITALSEISQGYDALFVDLWGCVHDGVRALPEACAALSAYRRDGGAVVLVTNSPRPRGDVERQLRHFGVPDDAWDTIATSGDSARSAMFMGAVGHRVWFIGQPQEVIFFDPIKVVEDPVDITRVDLDEAEGIVCTGPFDPMADPEVMRPQFLAAKTRGLKLLCANPDIVVDRGEVREWCAGALARLYTEMGGQSLYFGKPHPPIYDLSRRRLALLGRDVDEARILAIGDGAQTDIRGAMGEDIDSLFITGGLAARETKTSQQPEEAALSAYLKREKITPTYAIGYLR
ncbi:MAG: TIGR01459 family HAD-type hydrolase [Alphaproteobacteria bacterium HGW-Alphaproteobacteria-1]|jgi:HAD superfamily hydrolase (TIGR01459 family)|nr:MAG: TIGR01459 family HAD-type hydrolase [Alphaproteobacteria bacterium HGW-Alphaproteobacteria-1]